MKEEIKKNRFKRGMLTLALLLISTVFSLFIAEGTLLLLGYNPHHYSNQYQEPIINQYPNLKAFCKIEDLDEAIEQGLIQGPRGSLKYDETIGYMPRDGFNDKKNFYDNYDAFKKVLVLGDSFSWGCCADKEKGYVDLLNEYYKKSNILFFNTGVGGYGQNNQLAVLNKYFDVIKPNIVLLGFYTGNDFWDNLMPLDRYTAFPKNWVNHYEVILTKNSAKLRKRSLIEVLNYYKRSIGCHTLTEQNNSFKGLVRDRLVFTTRIGTQMWLLASSIKIKLNMFVKGKTQSNWKVENELRRDAKDNYSYEITKKHLKEIKEFLVQKNVPLYILLIPDISESTTTLVRSKNYHTATILFKELNLTFIDPFDVLTLQDYVGGMTGSKNGHWNNSGHLKMFKKTVSYFKDTFENIE